jgi:hypothetical protein
MNKRRSGKRKHYNKRGGSRTMLRPMVLRRENIKQSGNGVRKRKQRGGFFPLLALLAPAAIAVAKAAAVGAVTGTAGFAANKILTAATKK